jgi:CubicO group peptidase (beta-lactamase class C family)
VRTAAKILGWIVFALVALTGTLLAGLYVAEPVVTQRLLGTALGNRPGPVEVVRGGTQRALPVASAAANTLPENLVEKIVAWGESRESHAILVFHGGALQLEHYYEGFGPDTLTPTQSMHKSVLALLVGIAIDEGHIPSVEQPVSTWITEWAAPDDPRRDITIEHLLRQESGLDFPGMSFNVRGDWFGLFVGSDILPIILRQASSQPPGEVFEYSNVGPQVLGLVIERATGMRYAQYLSRALWQKIGAPDAYVLLDSEANGVARTFCCLDATARSWLKLGLLHLGGGQIGGEQLVPSDWISAVQTPGDVYANYGYLTWLGNTYESSRAYNSKSSATVHHSEAFAANDIVYFDGFGGQRVYVSRSIGLVVVRTGAQRMDWDDAALVNLVIRGLAGEDSVQTEDSR